ncbi:protein asteroid [Glossina fuscipes]|uniref:Protein asteroid n=1 Tax=Glossina fuscipes TaxID=7396 RepID=A0A8U0WF97_9MUSC|nr:protein asteroid [Glossina fuscipes]
MGVKGLTGYIARHAELYLTPYELHDCSLVIDGDNLACNLYKDASGPYSAFGGNYDDFYRTVVNFFTVLDECNIRPYVLMDGGYEPRKLRTVRARLRSKIQLIKRINPCGSYPIFPKMMNEVFVDAIRDCGVPIMRCLFEADDELAALARKLNCPVLSYDSDFYIYNVRYIPLITLTVKARTKLRKESASGRNLRKNEAKKLEKLVKGNRVIRGITISNQETSHRWVTYKYLDCCIYRVEKLITRSSLSKEKIPLFAALLGNDFISRKPFQNFFAYGLGKIGGSRKTNQHQRRIRRILEWLKHESLESALEKIMNHLPKKQRAAIKAQVESATSGYSNELCYSLDYFKNHFKNRLTDNEMQQEGLESEFAEECEKETSDEEQEAIEEKTSDEEHESPEEKTSEEEHEPTEEETSDEEQGNEIDDLESKEGEDNSSKSDDDSVNSDRSEEEEVAVDDKGEKTFPDWFLRKLHPGHFPRFMVDLMSLQKYINNPQIEHFHFNDCNEIALPILQHIFMLLNHVKGHETDNNSFTYLTRATRISNICFREIDIKKNPMYSFDPSQPNPLLFRSIFENGMSYLNRDALFSDIKFLPADIKLYFLAVVYWLHRSSHVDLNHLHALIICLVVLRTVDMKIPPVRNIRLFHKRFGNLIKKERLHRNKLLAEGVSERGMKKEVKALSIPDRMTYIPKSDCYLVQNELLQHFYIPEIFKKKYDAYSSVVLHAFAEFQSVVFQLHTLNALLDFPYLAPKMGQLYCGVFLYNLYNLLKSRPDVAHYVKKYIFRDSSMMFDFYDYLWKWCMPFVPNWKKNHATRTKNKKRIRKSKKNSTESLMKKDPYTDMLSNAEEDKENEEFFDLNNQFCALLEVS